MASTLTTQFPAKKFKDFSTERLKQAFREAWVGDSAEDIIDVIEFGSELESRMTSAEFDMFSMSLPELPSKK